MGGKWLSLARISAVLGSVVGFLKRRELEVGGKYSLPKNPGRPEGLRHGSSDPGQVFLVERGWQLTLARSEVSLYSFPLPFA